MKLRNNLFLTELVVCLFLFVIGAAVSVGLLVHARSISRSSEALTEAVYLAQSAAEDWKGGGKSAQQDLPAGYTVDCDEHDGVLDVSVRKDGSLVYSLKGVSRFGES